MGVETELFFALKRFQGKPSILSVCDPNNVTLPMWTVREDEEVYFELIASPDIIEAKLWINDIPIGVGKVAEEDVSGHYWYPETLPKGRKAAFFRNYFGRVELQIECSLVSGDQTIVALEPIEVVASKLSSERVEKLVQYVADQSASLPFALESVGSFLGALDGADSVNKTLNEAERIVTVFERNLPSFSSRPCSSLTPENRRLSSEESLNDEQVNVEWVLGNLGSVRYASDEKEALFEFEGAFYTFSEVEVERLVENYDVYENQAAHGLLVSIRSEMRKLQQYYSEKKTSAARKDSRLKKTGYVSFFDVIENLSRPLINDRLRRIERMQTRLAALSKRLSDAVPVTHYEVGYVKFTEKVKAFPHYRKIYEEASRWYGLGVPSLSEGSLLHPLTSLDKLYEYFCYFRILESLIANGYKVSNVSESDAQNRRLPQVVVLEKPGVKIQFLYEPDYWSPLSSNATGEKYVNVEGWSVHRGGIKKKKRAGALSRRTPDYVIDISTTDVGNDNRSIGMIVLDAKYSTPDIVFRTYLPELVMKYVHGVSRKVGGESPVKGLVLLHPPSMQREPFGTRSFHLDDYSLEGTRTVFPVLATSELYPDEQGGFEKWITKLIEKVIDHGADSNEYGLAGPFPALENVLSSKIRSALSTTQTGSLS